LEFISKRISVPIRAIRGDKKNLPSSVEFVAENFGF